MTHSILSRFSWALCFSWLLLLAGLYVFQVAALTQTAFALGSKEQRLNALLTQVRALETRTGQSRSTELPALADALSFEKIQGISYVRLIHPAVARNTAR